MGESQGQSRTRTTDFIFLHSEMLPHGLSNIESTLVFTSKLCTHSPRAQKSRGMNSCGSWRLCVSHQREKIWLLWQCVWLPSKSHVNFFCPTLTMNHLENEISERSWWVGWCGVSEMHHTKGTFHSQVPSKEDLPVRPTVTHVQEDRATVRSGAPCSMADKHL